MTTLFLFISLLIGLVTATTTTKTYNLADHSITAGVATVGVIAMLTGIVFTLVGQRILRVLIFMTGFIMLAALAFTILVNVEPIDPSTHISQWGEKRDLIYILTCLVAGLIGGMLLGYFYKVGVFGIGVLGGLALSSYALVFVSSFTPITYGVRIAVMILCALIGGVLISQAERHIVIVGSSLFGAMAFMYGLDMFANTGYADLLELLSRTEIQEEWKTLQQGLGQAVYGMLAGVVALFLLGVFVQYKYTSTDRSIRNSNKKH